MFNFPSDTCTRGIYYNYHGNSVILIIIKDEREENKKKLSRSNPIQSMNIIKRA